MDVYTELKIFSFVRCADVKSIIATNYEYHLQHFGCGIYGKPKPNRGLLEIGFVEENPIILTGVNGEEITVNENGIYIIPPESDYNIRAVNDGLHRHTTIIFKINFRNMKNVKYYSPPDGSYVTLPLVIPPAPGNSEVFTAIRAIMCKRTSQIEQNFFEECADFMGLIHKINTIMLAAKGIDSTSPGNRRYCERAKQYISENIEKKLTVGQIAKATGVSKNYLTNIFSQSEGMPIIEYINRRKLTHMLALIESENCSLSQAGEQVGITDPNYISRIFKRYYGMTYSEYKRNKKETELNQKSKDLT
jgi:AraC-like DNA-binding protein